MAAVTLIRPMAADLVATGQPASQLAYSVCRSVSRLFCPSVRPFVCPPVRRLVGRQAEQPVGCPTGVVHLVIQLLPHNMSTSGNGACLRVRPTTRYSCSLARSLAFAYMPVEWQAEHNKLLGLPPATVRTLGQTDRPTDRPRDGRTSRRAD